MRLLLDSFDYLDGEILVFYFPVDPNAAIFPHENVYVEFTLEQAYHRPGPADNPRDFCIRHLNDSAASQHTQLAFSGREFNLHGWIHIYDLEYREVAHTHNLGHFARFDAARIF